jgi:hypothetical protein
VAAVALGSSFSGLAGQEYITFISDLQKQDQDQMEEKSFLFTIIYANGKMKSKIPVV